MGGNRVSGDGCGVDGSDDGGGGGGGSEGGGDGVEGSGGGEGCGVPVLWRRGLWRR